MKKRCVILLLIFGFLCGCAGTLPQVRQEAIEEYQEPTIYIFNKDFDTVWNAILDVGNEKYLSFELADKNSGILKTEEVQYELPALLGVGYVKYISYVRKKTDISTEVNIQCYMRIKISKTPVWDEREGQIRERSPRGKEFELQYLDALRKKLEG